MKVDCFLCVCLLQAKATIKLSPKQEEIYDFQLKEPFLQEGGLMGPSCGSLCRLGLEALQSTSASSFLHRLRDSEPRPRASKSEKVAAEGRGTQIWDPGHSRDFFVLVWFILPASWKAAFKLVPGPLLLCPFHLVTKMIFLIISELEVR